VSANKYVFHAGPAGRLAVNPQVSGEGADSSASSYKGCGFNPYRLRGTVSAVNLYLTR